jgi:hypothetical protein
LLLKQKYIDAEWNSVTEVSAVELSTRVQQHGWQSIWLTGSFSRISLGRTSESASSKAVRSGLEAISARFNAAEVDSLHVVNYRGFYVARVTMRARHIQKDASLTNEMGS